MLLLCLNLACASAARAADARVIKVLPQFLDEQGRSSISPSLYDRDAYQAILRRNPQSRFGMRFAVQWKAKVPTTDALRLRVEMRGEPSADFSTITREILVRHHWLSHWDYIIVEQADYKKLGEITAWRVTLLDGSQVQSEQKSFLW